MSFALTTPCRDAIQEIYNEHHGWLYGWLRKKLNCSHNAADIAHDTFVRMMSSHELMELNEPRAYLIKAASRLMIDEARHKKIESLYLSELSRTCHVLESYPSPEEIVATMRTLEQIVLVLEALPNKLRETFLLHQISGLPQEEIAKRLGVSTRMVRKYLVQALVHCHHILEAIN